MGKIIKCPLLHPGAIFTEVVSFEDSFDAGAVLMSLFFCFVLIAIAWLLSAVIDGMAHLGQLLAILPLWLEGAIVVGLLAWLVGEP